MDRGKQIVRVSLVGIVANLFLVAGAWDTCISNDLLKVFYAAARENPTLTSCSFRSYPAAHGLMGVRTQLSRDIADFILGSLEYKKH